jgi:3-phenylpropionate/trans-cinnamate dioxygenase ferredoxin reductase subunit
VEEAVLRSGSVIPCDLALVGVGVRPDVDWLAGSGITVSNGVDVDDHCRTNYPDVFAAGDVANWPYALIGSRIRVEHFEHASAHGAYAAKAMLGSDQPFDTVPYFWSDQFRHNLQYVGHAQTWDRVVFRGDTAQRAFSAFYVKNGVVQAALAVNRPRDIRPIRRLIERNRPVDQAALADSSIDLRSLSA